MSAITNWGTAIISSLAGTLALVFAFIPKFVGFLVILLIGWIISSLVAKGVTALLRRVGFDRLSDRIGLTRMEQRMGMRMDTAGVLGRIVFWFLFLIFLVPAINALELTSISTLLDQIIGYIPNLFVAVIVLFLGALVAHFASEFTRNAGLASRTGNPNLLANIVRYAILGFTVIIALEQLRIAPEIFQILFSAIVGAAALALGLAFGLGGRESVQRWLARSEDRLSTPTTTTQSVEQMGRMNRPDQFRNVS